MPPRLSIAIPTLNRSHLLGRAIESALAQTSPDIEILVSDNASTDDTPSVIASYANRGLRTFRQPATIPASQNGKFLIEQARGEFFLGLSDDDYLEPDFAARVLSLFDSHPELSFVYTGCLVHYEDIQVPAAVGPLVEPGPDFLFGHYTGRREVSWCACVTRVRDLRALGPQPDDRILGDMYFWTRLAFLGPVGCVPQPISHYILLRPSSLNDNISHCTSVAEWASESSLLTREILASAQAAGLSQDWLASFRHASRLHVARSAANQFTWNRIRGASPLSALFWIPSALPFLAFNITVLSRIGAALLLPRRLLRALVLRSARRLARARSTA